MTPPTRPRNIGLVLPPGPGGIADLGELLGDAGISLEGGGVSTHAGRAIANFLVDDAGRARHVLEGHGLGPVAIHDVVTVRLDQGTPGQLGAFTRLVADAGIDVLVQYSDHDHRLVVVVAPDRHEECGRIAATFAPSGAGPAQPL